jgi:hypothetical protein
MDSTAWSIAAPDPGPPAAAAGRLPRWAQA